MATTKTTNLGLSTPGEERERLDRLLKLFDNSIVFGLKDNKEGDTRKRKRVGFSDVGDEEEDDRPKLTQRVKTFYVDSWPEVKFNADNTIRPRSSRLLGGTPITIDTAIALRHIVYGSPFHSFSREWKKSTLQFQDISSLFPWGLQTHRCGSRGLVLCVQAFLLKHLIFEREYFSVELARSALKPNEFERKRALIGAICEMLWAAGEKKRCCICLLQDDRCYNQDYRVRDDGITEKLFLYEFKKFQDLQLFVKRNIEFFQTEGSNGCILFLYSLALSRTIYKIKEDIQFTEESKDKLLTDNEECSQALINLLLTGQAVKHLHNGNMVYNQFGKMLMKPLKGIKQRSQIGFLFWDKTEDSDAKTEVGSMLKTPKFPMWITNINGQIGLLFSINLDLVSDWRIENRFTLYYYTGLPNHPKCFLNIETRHGRKICGRTNLVRLNEEGKIPQLDQCIMTKWFGAAVNWNGTPYFY
ncbi:inactive ubiquitin carboxyl-terminal hydrolase MINDY-4B-like isoform X1 [Mytilus galloprovincialis]|uniref:inactive ubiquitin carboxyl-terminal hydrolase MINDY-4B-like isoform X1 n=1 Tax=Mytilus galloprovincialis TaxID=29158 RepID=UPI003F7C202F